MVQSAKDYGDFIERHLRLSAEHGKGELFAACAKRKLQWWLRVILAEGRLEEADDTVRRFERLLSWGLKKEIRLKIIFPRMATFLFNIYFRLKRIFSR